MLEVYFRALSLFCSSNLVMIFAGCLPYPCRPILYDVVKEQGKPRGVVVSI